MPVDLDHAPEDLSMLLKVVRTPAIVDIGEFAYLQACRATEQREVTLFFDVLVQDLLPIIAKLNDDLAELIVLVVVLGTNDPEGHQAEALFELVVRRGRLCKKFNE